MGNMGVRLVEAGADGLVLFNRFYQPDIDLETLEAEPRLHLSTPYELLLPLRWIAILHGHVKASLAATGGIHDAAGLLKALLAGADVGMIASVLYQKGIAPDRQHPGRHAAVDGREGVRLGRATQGQHEPARTAPTRPPSSAATT